MSVLEVVDHYSSDMYHRFFDAEAPTGIDPWKAATMLQTLYLPELAAAHAALGNAVGNFQSYIAQGMQHRLDAWKKTGQKGAPPEAHCKMYSDHLAKMNAAALAVQASAQKVAGELTKV